MRASGIGIVHYCSLCLPIVTDKSMVVQSCSNGVAFSLFFLCFLDYLVKTGTLSNKKFAKDGIRTHAGKAHENALCCAEKL